MRNASRGDFVARAITNTRSLFDSRFPVTPERRDVRNDLRQVMMEHGDKRPARAPTAATTQRFMLESPGSVNTIRTSSRPI
jgi:hypothetical protein